MKYKFLQDRFQTSKEELIMLGSEFNSEALPLLEKLYNASYWILPGKYAAKKIIKYTFSESINDCDKTKANADWQSWIYRIWMREILEFYSDKEDDTRTVFDFIDHTEVAYDEVNNFFNSGKISSGKIKKELSYFLHKLPAVLRIPVIINEILQLNYEKISDLIDVPVGVIATRIYRARKLLYLYMKEDYDYEEKKRNAKPENQLNIIFELRRCALLADSEFTPDQKIAFIESAKNDETYKAEILLQTEMKKLFINLPFNPYSTGRLKAKIEKKAAKRFEIN